MTVEIELLPGLKRFVKQELAERFNERYRIMAEADDHILITYDGNWADLHTLRTAVAIYSVLTFDIPRPKALLGHQTFTAISREIHRIRSANESGAFHTFTISAAGRDSRVFQRFRHALADDVHLTYTPDEADLTLRVRPSEMGTGWDVLLRTTPRPLGTRGWRVEDMPGALHATIAASMIRLLGGDRRGPFVNLMSGSGTLLIEQHAFMPQQRAVGVEIDPEAIAKARHNLRAAGCLDAVNLFQMDATRTGLASESVTHLAADLPWGHLVGEGDALESLYSASLDEAYRIGRHGARFTVLTHAISQFEPVLAASRWHHLETVRLFQGGLHPRLYLLEKV